MFLVGLTGGIASGKSVTSSYFVERGIPVVDADKIAKEVVECGTATYWKVRHSFGEEYFDSVSGELLRKKLGTFIFQNEEARQRLNRIVHPQVRKRMLFEVFKYFIAGHSYCILDIPLLFETKTCLKLLSKTILIYCDQDTQLQRLMSRDAYSSTEAQSRIDAQMPLRKKLVLADFVVDNNGSKDHTFQQIDVIIEKLNASKRHWLIRILFLILIALLLSTLIWWH